MTEFERGLSVDSVDYDICETQEEIYKYMAKKGYEMKTFSNAFLASDFCRRAFDTIYSRFQTEFPNECEDFYMPEIGEKLIKTKEPYSKFDIEIVGEVGFLYRQLYIFTSIPSCKLSEIIPYDDMYAFCCYTPYGEEDRLFDDIVERYNLPLKRYDSDVIRFTKEELDELKRKELEEHKRLEKLYLNK